MRSWFARLLALPAAALLAGGLSAQTITVTTVADTVDVDWQTATVADLPGPDGLVSLSEACIAANHTPGPETIGFAIPASELGWFGPQYEGIAVFHALTGYYWNASDTVTVDGTTQTAFAGDTNDDGAEVLLYGKTLSLGGAGSVLRGFHSTSISVYGSGALVEDNTGSMNITLYGGSGSTIRNNTCGTIKIDRSSDNVVVGNVMQRVRVQGWDPVAANNRIGGPAPADRNIIRGYGSYNSEGLPSGHAVQLFYTSGVVVENNWIGTGDGLTVGNVACTMGISIESWNEDVLIKDNLISGILGVGIGPHHAGQLFGRGILASGSGDGLTVVGNVIGPDVNGDPTLGAVWGLDLGDPVTHPLSMTGIVIEDNEIAGHILNGVTVGRNTGAVRLTANSIHDNGWLGIDLIPSGYGYGVSPNDPLDADTGGSGVQNFPELLSVMRQGASLRVIGVLHSAASTAYTLEFFASPECDESGHGEGEVYLGATAVATDGKGDAVFDVLLPVSVPAGHVVSATATDDAAGATSEFAACLDAVWEDLGGGTLGVAGAPRAMASGALTPGSTLAFALDRAAPSSAALVFVSFADNPAPFLGGTLHALPVAALLPLATDADGAIASSAPFPAVPSGTQLVFQVGVADAWVPGWGACLSNGVMGTVP
jgi:hypothetical protein